MKLTREENMYLQGLLEQEISGLSKSETFEDEFLKEISFADLLLHKLYNEEIENVKNK
jgi:hypothetical protein